MDISAELPTEKKSFSSKESNPLLPVLEKVCLFIDELNFSCGTVNEEFAVLINIVVLEIVSHLRKN